MFESKVLYNPVARYGVSYTSPTLSPSLSPPLVTTPDVYNTDLS